MAIAFITTFGSIYFTFIVIWEVKIQSISYRFEEAVDRVGGYIIQGTDSYTLNLKMCQLN